MTDVDVFFLKVGEFSWEGLCFSSPSRLLQVSQSFTKFFSCVCPKRCWQTLIEADTHTNHSLGTHRGARLDSFANFIIFSASNKKTKLLRLDDFERQPFVLGSHHLLFVLWFDTTGQIRTGVLSAVKLGWYPKILLLGYICIYIYGHSLWINCLHCHDLHWPYSFSLKASQLRMNTHWFRQEEMVK